MVDETKYLFLDTMIFLHFRPIEEIHWTKLLNCNQVQILLPRITIREMDKHKNSHPNAKIKERARRILKMLENKLTSGDSSLPDNVTLAILDMHPHLDYASFGLNPDWADDILLASILYYKQENPKLSIVLVTDDTGARIKARSLGIETLELPNGLRLPTEPDPTVEENRKLREKLAKLAEAMPALELQFSDGENFRRLTYSTTPAESAEERAGRIATELNKEREKHLWKKPLIASFSTPKKSEIERYKSELKEFIEKYKRYLNNLADWQVCKTKLFPFEVELMNDGTAPANDIHILMHTPEGFLLRKKGDLKPKPSPPTKPVPPRSNLDIMQNFGRPLEHIRPSFDIPHLTRISREPPNVSGPIIRRTNNYEAEYHIRRLKHGFSVKLAPLFFDFSESQELNSFHISYWINAADMPENVEGELHIILEPETQ